MKEKLDKACAELQAKMMNPYAIQRRERRAQAVRKAWKDMLESRRNK